MSHSVIIIDFNGDPIGEYFPPHENEGERAMEHAETSTLKLNRKYLRDLMCDAIRHCDKHDKEKK